MTPPGREPVLGNGLPLEPRHSLIRRLGRRALRFLRPIAAPLMHRLDVRMRWAVDRTATAETVRKQAEVARAQQAESAATIDQLRTDVDELRSELTIRLDALALSHLRSRTFSSGLARVEERLEVIQAGLVDQRATTAQLIHDRSTAEAEALSTLIQRADLILQHRSIQLGTEIAVRTDHGYLLVPLEDEALVLAMIETAGRLEPGTLSVLLSLLQPGDLMLDVGANIGTLCLPAARQVGASGRIIAFEPTPRAASVLRRSLALNALEDRVELLNYAAGETEGVGQLSVSVSTTHSSLVALQEGVEQIEVPVRPLDACVPSGQSVNLVKLDVEGAELQAWRGMSRIISESPDLAVIVEFGPSHLERWGVTITEWLDILCAPGFTPWEIDEANGAIRPLREEGLADIYSINLLLLRQPPSTRPKLRVI